MAASGMTLRHWLHGVMCARCHGQRLSAAIAVFAILHSAHIVSDHVTTD